MYLIRPRSLRNAVTFAEIQIFAVAVVAQDLFLCAASIVDLPTQPRQRPAVGVLAHKQFVRKGALHLLE